MKEVAVVILNWNGERLLPEFLPTVCRNTPTDVADVIVADNGSKDGSIALLRRDFPHVRLIEFPQNHGFAEGYNRAIARLEEYRYIVLLNSDVETPEGWLQPMLSYADAHPEVGAMQPKLRAYRDKERFEYAGACGGYLDCNGFPYCRGRIFKTVEEDKGQYDDVREIFWATGAALFVRREVYLQAGGLDAEFFAHMEEIDLCWRIRRAGYSIVVVPQSVVYHLGGATLDNASPYKLYLNYRNNLLMMYKNLPLKEGRYRIFVRKLYDGVAAAMYLLAGQWQYVKAVWDAHIDYRSMRRVYHNQPETNLLQCLPEGRRNIIFDYFIRRRKRFSALK